MQKKKTQKTLGEIWIWILARMLNDAIKAVLPNANCVNLCQTTFIQINLEMFNVDGLG